MTNPEDTKDVVHIPLSSSSSILKMDTSTLCGLAIDDNIRITTILAHTSCEECKRIRIAGRT